MGTSRGGGTDCGPPSPLCPQRFLRLLAEQGRRCPWRLLDRAEKAVRGGAMAVRALLSCAQGLCWPVCGGSPRFKTQRSPRNLICTSKKTSCGRTSWWPWLCAVGPWPIPMGADGDRTLWLLWLPPGETINHHEKDSNTPSSESSPFQKRC
nr:uncharacterized protein LOC103347375 isoform X2 [Oryctolagus cuniculus]